MEKEYDLILFGVTGFTGKLAAEHLWTKVSNGLALNWAVCARNESKAKEVLTQVETLVQASSKAAAPTVLVADLVCNTEDERESLKNIVSKTKVVITTAGPFQKYGTTLVALCAELGVHYADITGETKFVRQTISLHDSRARETGATIVSHCGNDCIPQDLTVLEMHKYAEGKGAKLASVVTYNEVPPSVRLSGGTIRTAFLMFDKEKNKNSAAASDDTTPSYDPLLMVPATESDQGASESKHKESRFATQITRKKSEYVAEFKTYAEPYIMSPVMANCVRRSNALLGYNESLQYGDLALKSTDAGMWSSLQFSFFFALFGAAAVLPPLRGLLPQPGEGPTREAMEAGYMITHGRGTVVNQDETTSVLKTTFHFRKDIAYLMTAETLVECGLLLVNKEILTAGVVTPAVAFGTELTKHLCDELQVTFAIEEASS